MGTETDRLKTFDGIYADQNSYAQQNNAHENVNFFKMFFPRRETAIGV